MAKAKTRSKAAHIASRTPPPRTISARIAPKTVASVQSAQNNTQGGHRTELPKYDSSRALIGTVARSIAMRTARMATPYPGGLQCRPAYSGVRKQRRDRKEHLRPIPTIRRSRGAAVRVAKVFLVQISRNAFIVIGRGKRRDERCGDDRRSHTVRNDNPA